MALFSLTLLLCVPFGFSWLRLYAPQQEHVHNYPAFFSKAMGKPFRFEVWLPPGRSLGHCQDCKVLIANDGQDMRAVNLRQTLDSLTLHHNMPPVVVVAVHAGARLHDYGIAAQADYMGRGELAAGYSRFVVEELLPFVQKEFNTHTGPEHTAVMGFSLGGLSAFDMAFQHPQVFGRVGVFSGSFWWRQKAYGKGYTDADRIMHNRVAQAKTAPPLRYWFETGTADETNDRNKDGIIDSIGDCQDLITALHKLGHPDADITYVEIAGGRHNQQTWGQALPHFLYWAFGG